MGKYFRASKSQEEVAREMIEDVWFWQVSMVPFGGTQSQPCSKLFPAHIYMAGFSEEEILLFDDRWHDDVDLFDAQLGDDLFLDFKGRNMELLYGIHLEKIKVAGDPISISLGYCRLRKV